MDETQLISVEELQIGHYVVLPYGWGNHPFLFNKFKIKDQTQLQQLKTMGVRAVPIDLSKSTPAPTSQLSLQETLPVLEPVESEEEKSLRLAFEQNQQAQKETRRSIRQAEKQFSNSVSPLRESLSQLNLKPDEGLATVADLVRRSASQLIQCESSVGFHLIRSIRDGDSLLLHSLNVAFISMLIAKDAGWEPIMIQDAGLAGLVHDLGEMKIPTQITRKKTELTKAEVNYIRMHPNYGFEQLNQMNAYTKEVRLAVQQHHECLDGSGYPLGLRSDAISPLAKLIGIVDTYEELLHPRNGIMTLTPNQVISILFKKADKQYDKSLIQLLIKVLGIYPPGSFVVLTDGTIGLVMSSEPSASLKPVILPYEKGRVPEGVDLIYLQKDERTISEALPLTKLTQPQIEFFSVGKHACYYYSLPTTQP